MEARSDAYRSIGAREPLIIRRVDAIPLGLPLSKPVAMAGVTVRQALNIVVRIESADGTVGWGEAASAPTMTGDTLGSLLAAVRDHLGPLLVGAGCLDASRLVPQALSVPCSATPARIPRSKALSSILPADHPACQWLILSAVPCASRSRRCGFSAIPRRSEDIAEANAKRAQGFGFFKLKIGTKPVDSEIASTLALRKGLGAATLLCADANCGLTFGDACRYVESVRDGGPDVRRAAARARGLSALARLTRISSIPIGADEAIHSLADIAAHERCGAAGVSLKLIKLGGMTAAMEAAQLCQRLGLAINVAAKIAESSIASAAAIHLACAVPAVDWGVSLTHFYLAEDLAKDALALSAGNGCAASRSGAGD